MHEEEDVVTDGWGRHEMHRGRHERADDMSAINGEEEAWAEARKAHCGEYGPSQPVRHASEGIFS